ncbi:MAG TPA: R3H domain-containing nucleic acid-binding protein [Patescibacteria group bacterium]|nr:R3H domain-containing nucleic acid-binding protein [Patescibacteria group bacterium]
MSLSKIKIEKTAKGLIGHFDEKAKITIEEVDEVWKLNIESEMSPLLIGRRGQTLQALEHLLRLMLARQTEEFLAVNLDISGYKASREVEIIFQAKEASEKVLSSAQEQALPPMNAFERRLVHLTLSDIEGIETESEGVEPERRIVIRKKQSR